MSQALLRSRKDTFFDYTDEGFEKAFGRYYSVLYTIPVAETSRTMYVMERR